MTTQAKAAIVKGIEESINVREILDDIIMHIANNLAPEDVFGNDALETWAENNDYVKSFE